MSINYIEFKWKYFIGKIVDKHKLYSYDSLLCILRSNNKKLFDDLKFYKSIFKTHQNSAIFNLRIKTINNNRLWVDKIKVFSDYKLLHSLDKDDEVIEWLKPVRCER